MLNYAATLSRGVAPIITMDSCFQCTVVLTGPLLGNRQVPTQLTYFNRLRYDILLSLSIWSFRVVVASHLPCSLQTGKTIKRWSRFSLGLQPI